jgi:hypothetical protein
MREKQKYPTKRVQNAQFSAVVVVQPSKTEKYTHLLIDSEGIV